MTRDPNHPHHKPGDAEVDERTGPRRPYSPPAIRREEVFESVAAGCTQYIKSVCGVGFTAS